MKSLDPRGFRLAVIALWLCCAGCGKAPEPPLRVGTHVWPGYESLFLAKEKGYFGSTAIRLVEVPAASESIRAFENDDTDAATLTVDEVLRLADHGVEPRIVLLLDMSAGADALLARPGIERVEDLRGRAVGVETTAEGGYLMSRILALHHLKTSDLQFKPLLIEETVSAYQQGTVDAVVTFEPHKTRLLAAGARVLFDSARMPGEIIDVLVVRKNKLDRFWPALQKLVEGQFRALEFLQAHPEEAAGIMVRREPLTPAEFLAALGGLRLLGREDNIRLLGGDPSLRDTIRRTHQFMREHKMLEKDFDPASLLENRLVRGARP